MKKILMLSLATLLIVSGCGINQIADNQVEDENPTLEDTLIDKSEWTTYKNTIYGFEFLYPESEYSLYANSMENLSYGEEKDGIRVSKPNYYIFEIEPVLSNTYTDLKRNNYPDSVKNAFQEQDIQRIAEMAFETVKNDSEDFNQKGIPVRIIDELKEIVVGEKQAYQYTISDAEIYGFTDEAEEFKISGRILERPNRVIFVSDGATLYKINLPVDDPILNEVLNSLKFSN